MPQGVRSVGTRHSAVCMRHGGQHKSTSHNRNGHSKLNHSRRGHDYDELRASRRIVGTSLEGGGAEDGLIATLESAREKAELASARATRQARQHPPRVGPGASDGPTNESSTFGPRGFIRETAAPVSLETTPSFHPAPLAKPASSFSKAFLKQLNAERKADQRVRDTLQALRELKDTAALVRAEPSSEPECSAGSLSLDPLAS